MTPTEIVLLVARTLESLDVPYVLVGSLASSARGVPRATNDADMVVELRPEHVAPLIDHLSTAFYVDADAARRAIARGRSFNAIHLDTGFKIDLFVPPPGGFGLQQVARRVRETALAGGEPAELEIATAEDVVLGKLLWFRAGGMTSERQWQDVIGVVRVQQEALALDYLRAWATTLEIADLLERALAEGLRPTTS
ncbi:MAG: hypothetical protein AB1806_13155 [Acidobacteriota bacterium]